MRGQPSVVNDFRGGVNIAASPYSLDLNQARDLRNVNSSVIGSLRKRNGFKRIGLPAISIKSLFSYNGATDYLVGFADDGISTDVYKITLAGTITSIKGISPINLNRRWTSIQAPSSGGEGSLWMVNGVNVPKQWSGSGEIADWTASTGTLPNGRFIQYFDNRVFITGVDSDPSKLYWSALGDPRAWATPDGGFTTFDPDDGESISGLGTVGPYLLVFKPSKTYVVFNSDTGGYRRISNEIGCIAYDSIIESDSGTFFLSTTGRIMVTDGNTLSSISSNSLEPILENLIPNENIKASGIFNKERYYLSIPQNTFENSIILEYDTRFQSWFIHEIQINENTSGGVTSWAKLNPQREDKLYASVSNGLVSEAFVNNLFQDDNHLYESYWITQWHTFSMPHIRKVMRQLRADALGSFDTFVALSFMEDFSSVEDIVWDSAGDADTSTFGSTMSTFGDEGHFGGSSEIVSEHRYYTLGTGRSWSFKFSSKNTLAWELYAYTMAVDKRED